MVQIAQFVWDSWNREHIARHAVEQSEVEEVVQNDYIAFETYKRRILIIGTTSTGRTLAIIIEPMQAEGIYYVVTARVADRKERRMYEDQKGGVLV